MNSGIGNATVLLWDMFYLGNPRRHMYEDVERVPRIYEQVNARAVLEDYAFNTPETVTDETTRFVFFLAIRLRAVLTNES